MNGKKTSVSAYKNVLLSTLKAKYLKSVLDHKPTSEELSNYYLSHNDLELDESKQIGELKLSSYNLECCYKTHPKLQIGNEKKQKQEEEEEEEEDLPVENPIIKLSISMNGKKTSVSAYKNVLLSTLKAKYLKYVLDHKPTSEELSNYYLNHNDLELDESKQIGELNLSSYNLECMPYQRVRIFAEGENEPQVIKFGQSISVEQIISTVVGSDFLDSCCITEIGSSIVLKNIISTSCDLARILLIHI